jgi:hypothetical protein
VLPAAGEIWGAMSADSTDRAPLPDRVETRLAEFTELIRQQRQYLPAASD